MDAVQRGLVFDNSNTGLLTVRQRAEKARLVKEEKERKRLEALKKQNAEKERMGNALKVILFLSLTKLR